MSEKKVEGNFYKNRQAIECVKDYLIKSNYYQIDNAEIEKEKLVLDIFLIDKNGYGDQKTIYIKENNLLLKNNKDVLNKLGISKRLNAIYFQYDSGDPNSVGIVYSIDGKKPVDDQLVKLTPLKEKNWYFYIEDCHKGDIECGT